MNTQVSHVRRFMIRSLGVLALLLSCCAQAGNAEPTPPAGESVLAAIEEFEAEFVPLTQEQRDMVMNTVVWTVEKQQFYKDRSERTIGWTDGEAVFIPNTVGGMLRVTVEIHEYLHITAGMALGTLDPCHVNERLFSCDDSVEYRAARSLGWSGSKLTGYTCGISTCK